MAKLSRSAKNQQLHTSLDLESGATVNNTSEDEYSSIANKRDAYLNPIKTTADKEAAYRKELIKNEFSDFRNEYLDEYINEVKQYNIEQGLSMASNTQIDILRELKGEKPKPVVKKKADGIDINQGIPSMNSIPVDNTEEMQRTREDIASTVQQMIANDDFDFDVDENTEKMERLESDFRKEKAERERLLNETHQLRTQLDEYEDNLSDVNDKVKHTNRILNFVLVVLIFALLVVLAIVLYWILLSKGII